MAAIPRLVPRAAATAALGLLAACAVRPGDHAGPAPTPPPIAAPAPGPASSPALGHAAIAPAAGGITDAQVRAYVLSHRMPATLTTSDVAILATRFVTAQQVRLMLHSAHLGLPEDEPMCVVVMSGRFVFSGPPGQTPTFPYGIEVFDARTGNLIQSGGMPRVPDGR